MREILFRGKRLDNGNWIHGLLWRKIDNDEKIYISRFPLKVNEEKADPVDPDTVGQYTGLQDKNGVKIFEGDIVAFDAYSQHFIGVVTIENGNTDVRCKNASPFLDDVIYKRDGEVLGNIYDNPELLKQID